jgi:hypothetical protein
MINKTFDEMTGNGQATTSQVTLFEKTGWLSPTVFLKIYFGIVVGDDVRQPWLIADSRLTEWGFIGHTEVLALVDGKRHRFEGFVNESDTKIDAQEVVCIESFHTPISEEFLKELAEAESAKIRLGGADFGVPMELLVDVKELLRAI